MVLENRSPHLSNLVRLSLASFPLQVQLLFDACLAEVVVTASNSHLESQAVQQIHEIVKPDVCVSSPTQHALERFLDSHTSTLPHLPTRRASVLASRQDFHLLELLGIIVCERVLWIKRRSDVGLSAQKRCRGQGRGSRRLRSCRQLSVCDNLVE